MEAVKGVIFGHDKIEQGYKYLLGFVLVTDEPLDNVALRGETVIIGGSEVNMLTPALQCISKYKPPHAMGDLSGAVMEVANWLKAENLEKAKPEEKPKKGKKK